VRTWPPAVATSSAPFSSTPTARPSIVSRAVSMRTGRSIVIEKDFHSAITPSQLSVATRASIASRKAASTSRRGTTRPSSRRSDTAGGTTSGGSLLTFRPTPTLTKATSSPSVSISESSPQSLAPPTRMSFGHFTPASTA